MNKFSLQNLANKRVLVMGLGLNQGGVGVARFLAKAGARALVTDLKKRKELLPSLKKLKNLPIKYVLGRHREKDFRQCDLVIQNPAVPFNSKYLKIARSKNTPIETDMGIFLELCPSQNIIGISGTKGKGTTASLIYHIFKTAKQDVVLAGNIGISVLDALSKIKPKTIVILEISSWQLEGLKKHKFSPKIAVLTNILPDHLDRYKNFKEYIIAEKLILKYQKQKDISILNFDNILLRKPTSSLKSQAIWFSRKSKVFPGCYVNPVTPHPKERGFRRENNFNLPPLATLKTEVSWSNGVKNNQIICRFKKGEKKIINLGKPPLLGEHNIENVLAAVSSALIYKITTQTIQGALKSFPGLPHRLEFILKLKGIKFYNDSAATIPEAVIQAIHSFKNPIILILGGKDKKLPFKPLILELSKNQLIKKFIILEHPEYDASRKILKLMKNSPLKKKVLTAPSMKRGVKMAFKESSQGDIVLLSPGAASFGMFQNEFDRGRKFIQAVKALK